MDWKDPYPKPIIKIHEGFHVLRDDLLGTGSKTRFIDHLIQFHPATEWVYGSSPACGYAQISLAAVCKKYKKKAVLFVADRKEPHPYQQRALSLGACLHWVPLGFLTVTEKRARDYALMDRENRHLCPMGFDHPTVIEAIVKVAKALPIEPDVIWCAGSSGTLTRGLQIAFPDAKHHVVSVGHKMDFRQIGAAKHHRYHLEFAKEARVLPPFPSVPTYDAKAWEVMTSHYKEHKRPKVVLFWNVGA